MAHSTSTPRARGSGRYGHSQPTPSSPSSSRSRGTTYRGAYSGIRPKRRDSDIPSTTDAGGPHASYLQIALSPSKSLSPHPPSSHRKLLILNLNGTLLLRSQNRGVRGKTVYLRPFMSVLRQYLFSSSTAAWLDSMIWSSAQQRNVDDMVDKCFGEEKINLTAIWARESLGLRPDEFREKVQTTMDLEKPWSAITSASSNQKSAAKADVKQKEQAYSHSALTTIFLDDTPLKARLQPWNHVCVPEYTDGMRSRDMDVARIENSTSASRNQAVSSGSIGKPESSSVRGKPHAGASDRSDGYDQTLLAIIGILEAIKDESNVAGWIRAGGLWGPQNDTPADKDKDKDKAAGKKSENVAVTTKKSEEGVAPSEKSADIVAAGKKLEEGVVAGKKPEGAVAASQKPEDVVAPSMKSEDTVAARKNTERSDASKAVSHVPPHPEQSDGLWFENPVTLAHWVSRGKETVSALKIALDAGVKAWPLAY